MGYGRTKDSEAVWIAQFGSNMKDADIPEHIPYPPKGYVPHDLVFPKWSFSIADKYRSDFSEAKVTMRVGNEKNIRLRIFRVEEDIGDPTLVWDATGLFTKRGAYPELNNKFLGKNIKVSITGIIVDGERKVYEYVVTPIDAKGSYN